MTATIMVDKMMMIEKVAEIDHLRHDNSDDVDVIFEKKQQEDVSQKKQESFLVSPTAAV